MKFYARYPGDFMKKTAGLSMAQRGAYTSLLDWCYANEAAVDPDEVYLVCGAISEQDRADVDKVLRKFFNLGPDGYTNPRALEEIAAAQPRISAAKKNGKKGGRPPSKKPTDNPLGNPMGLPQETQQEPRSKANQSSQSSSLRSEDPPTPQEATSTVARGGGSGLKEPTMAAEPAPSAAPPSPPPSAPTPAGLVCKALKAAGIADVNPGHPKLLTLLAAGATVEEFTGFVAGAQKAGAGFAWILAAVANERTRAAETAKGLHQGSMTDTKPWHATRKGIEDMGEKLGLGRWDAQAFNLGRGEMFMAYEKRVHAAVEARGVVA